MENKKVLYTCKNCGKEVFTKYGSGRFCCRACANSRKPSEETKQKISKSVAETKAPNAKCSSLNRQYCKECGKLLSIRNKTGLCYHCNLTSPIVKQRRIEAGKKGYQTMLERGNHNSWQSRNTISYAEKFWIEVLNNNSINYKREVSVKHEKSNYFLDFLIEKDNKLIDLEIDGKQHKYADRKESDKIRDDYLQNLNYIVYRISWNEVNSENGKLKMQEKIKAFLDFYTNL